MKKIKISDVTLRESGKNSADLSFSEKVGIVKLLVKIGVDAIETAEIINVKADALFLHTIAPIVGDSTIVCPVGLDEESLKTAWAALSLAKNTRLQVAVPTSTVQMEYNCHLKPKAVLEAVEKQIKAASTLCKDVEFVAEDATRSEADFLAEVVKTAIKSGANVVTFKDSAGVMLPDETYKFVEDIKSLVPELDGVVLSFECSDKISMGVASALCAVKAGVSQLKTAVSTGNILSLGSLFNTLKEKGDALNIGLTFSGATLLQSTAKIEKMLTDKKSANSPFESGVKSADENFTLDKCDDIKTVEKCTALLGYELSEEDLAKVYERFSSLAEKKRIGAKELDAIVASCAMQVTPTYMLVSYVINSGNIMTASANIVLEKGGENLSGISLGDGPIDAAFLAIEKIIGTHYELDDFQIQSVTEGREAVGEALVKLRAFGKLYSGRGISTDIIGASIRAYISALNKICFDNAIN